VKTHYSVSPAYRQNRARLGVEALEGREVPATLLDLTTAGSQVMANGAIFQQTAPVESSDFLTFLSVQRNSMESGYNTDARPFQLDQVGDLTVTHSLQLADIPTVTVGTTAYRLFVLDIDQTTKKPLISLEDLRIYLGSTGDLTGYNSKTETLAGLTPIFNMDTAQDVTVRLNWALNGTSAPGDAYVMIPDSAFTGGGTFVYLYSKFSGATDGAESWGVFPVTPAGTASISGFVFGDLVPVGGDGIFQPPDDPGIDQVTMRLEREVSPDVWLFVAQTMTDGSGAYSFTNLTEGSYRVTRVDEGLFPDDIFNGLNHVGTVNSVTTGTDDNPGTGETDPPTVDSISDIVLGVGDSGIDYNFAMLPDTGGGT
jgi:SdrD B-like domain